jgi:hypothetical protein
MMKVDITHARAQVTGRFAREGSVLAQTVRAQCLGIEVRLEVESPEAPQRVAGVLRNAENGCYVIQALVDPVPVQSIMVLNGQPLDLGAFPPPHQDRA